MSTPSVTRPTRPDHPARLLGDALASAVGGMTRARDAHHMRFADGSSAPLDVERWIADPPPEELELLAGVTGPALDIGCGPGRHVVALADRGIEALGIDMLPEALEVARARGASVLECSVFEELPLAGEWATALLIDGNVGIGGHPIVLLRRVHEILRPGGVALVELEQAGVGLQAIDGRLETPAGRSTDFPWGRVGVDGVEELAAASGFEVGRVWTAAGRHFARLVSGPDRALLGI